MSASGILCAATTSRGNRCINTARDGAFCPGHDPRNACGAPTTRGTSCRRPRELGATRCSKHQR